MKWIVRISVRGKGADLPWAKRERYGRRHVGTANEIRKIVYSWERVFHPSIEMRERWSVKRYGPQR